MPKKKKKQRVQPSAAGLLVIRRESDVMRVGVHLAQQQTANPRRAVQLKLVDEGDLTADSIITDTSGLDLTYSEAKALYAYLNLLHTTGYHQDGAYNGHNSALYPVTKKETYGTDMLRLPILFISQPEYLEAFGLSRNARGNFPSASKKNAIQALINLSQQRRTLWYERTIKNEKKTVSITDSLLRVTEIKAYDSDLQSARNGKVDSRATWYRIEPLYVLVDQLGSYHFKSDIQLYSKIEDEIANIRGSRRGRKGSHHATFIYYLQTLNLPEVTITKANLATKIRLGYLAEQRRRADIDKAVGEAVEVALRLGYLLSAKEVVSKDGKPMFVFNLNPEMCSRVKKRKMIEASKEKVSDQ